MDCENGKAAWRKRFKQLRAQIPSGERESIDGSIALQVLALPEYQAADAVLAYLSFGFEVETRGIISRAWSDGKTVLLPRCIPDTRAMAWYRVDSFDGLVKSPLGVEEPVDDPEFEMDPTALGNILVLVPGLTFDRCGYRLGYGGGYYDVFLSGMDPVKTTAVGLCRSCQLVARVEVADPHDLPVSIVATETQAYRA